jgi:hypothetical protein
LPVGADRRGGYNTGLGEEYRLEDIRESGGEEEVALVGCVPGNHREIIGCFLNKERAMEGKLLS